MPPSTPWTADRIAAYRLVRVWECGSQTIHRIQRLAQGHLSAFLADRSAWMDAGLTTKQQECLRASIREDIDADIERFEKQHVSFLLPDDPDFPHALKAIPDPPAALFVRGAPIQDGLRIAIVGTRGMTSYGKRSTEAMIHDMRMSGTTIISGLAFGVDACAHRTAISDGLSTIAVVPSGVLDTAIMPQTHIRLAHKILDAGGSILSEQAPGTPTLPYLYLHRNRLISGLADATIVIEAGRTSGALTTAKLALEQGRDVLAVPGSIWSESSQGTNALIRDGAIPYLTIDDLWQALGVRHHADAARASASRADLPVTPEETELLNALGEPRSPDDLVRSTGRSPGEIGSLLSILELKGCVIQTEPGVYEKERIAPLFDTPAP